MTTARALRADQDWVSVLSASARGAVHSSFDHALNIEVDGRLLTVAAGAGVASMPSVLVCDAARLPRLVPGTPVRISGERVQAGPWTVLTSGVPFVDCRVVPLGDEVGDGAGAVGDCAGAVRDGAGAVPGPAALLAEAERDATPGSFVLRANPSPAERVIHRRLHHGAGALQRAIAGRLDRVCGDPVGHDALASATRALVGLGAGLTPSGDDYLVGALAVLHQVPGGRGRAAAEGIGAGLRPEQLGATTAVAAQYLRAAAEARFHHHIAAAARAALTDAAAVPAAFETVRRIGSTSGADVLLGIAHTAGTCLPAQPLTTHTGLKEAHS